MQHGGLLGLLQETQPSENTKTKLLHLLEELSKYTDVDADYKDDYQFASDACDEPNASTLLPLYIRMQSHSATYDNKKSFGLGSGAFGTSLMVTGIAAAATGGLGLLAAGGLLVTGAGFFGAGVAVPVVDAKKKNGK